MARPPPAVRRPKAGVNRWKLGTDIDFFISAEIEDQMSFHPFALLIVRMMGAWGVIMVIVQ